MLKLPQVNDAPRVLSGLHRLPQAPAEKAPSLSLDSAAGDPILPDRSLSIPLLLPLPNRNPEPTRSVEESEGSLVTR